MHILMIRESAVGHFKCFHMCSNVTSKLWALVINSTGCRKQNTKFELLKSVFSGSSDGAQELSALYWMNVTSPFILLGAAVPHTCNCTHRPLLMERHIYRGGLSDVIYILLIKDCFTCIILVIFLILLAASITIITMKHSSRISFSLWLRSAHTHCLLWR